MRFVSVLALACAAATALALPGAAAAGPARPSGGHHMTVRAEKPAQSQLPKPRSEARPAIVPTATCDPNDTTGPAVVSATVAPASVVVDVNDSSESFVYTAVVSDPCSVGNVVVDAERVSGDDSVQFHLFFENYDDNGDEVWAAEVGIDPGYLWNYDAGTWSSAVDASDKLNNHVTEAGPVYYLKRKAKVTNDAAPEPVSRGAAITVTGTLTRANWDDWKYHGYATQPVDLEFRTASGTYQSVKRITTSTTGALKTTVTATVDGCFRFRYKGGTTTPAVAGVGDCVDVR
ncbi:MAG: hypothetical protein J2P24_01670 [Streptosporangiales bacterium]|nr:hypothetical protein [Streptosporangiales bacterium]